MRFEDCTATVHETADPEVVIAEYGPSGTVTTTGRRASASFVMVLRVRDGRIVHLREYQDVRAISAALDPGAGPDGASRPCRAGVPGTAPARARPALRPRPPAR